MSKLLAIFGAILITASASAASYIPAACVNLPMPTPAQKASMDEAVKILNKVVPKDALDLDRIRNSTQKLVDKHPDDPHLLGVLGNIEFRAGDLPASIVSLNRSMQIMPCMAYIQFTAAKYYALIGDQPHAQLHLEYAYGLDPTVPEIAQAWRATHAPLDPPAPDSTGLQSRPKPTPNPNGIMPFGVPEQPLFPAVTQITRLSLNKSEPPRARGMAMSQIGRPYIMPTIGIVLNGKPMTLMLDLNGDGITLKPSAARRAAVSGKPATLQIGGIAMDNVPVHIIGTSEGDSERPDQWTDGIVGLYFFSRSLITLDFWGDSITLSPLPTTAPTVSDTHQSGEPHWTNLYVVPKTHQLLVPADIGRGPLRLFLLSPVAELSSIAPDTANHATDVHEYGGPYIDTYGAHYSTNRIRISISNKEVDLPRPQIRVEPVFPQLGVGTYGTLARDALQGVNLTFNYRDHQMRAF